EFILGLFLLLGSVAYAGMTIQRPSTDDTPAQRFLPMVDPKVARYDNACVNFAATVASNAEASRMQAVEEWRTECNSHPSRDICLETADMVKTSRGSNMGLTCSG
ncbi:MAG: hypothetical protein ACXVCI_20955, partial [Bdellovibrionota bacterium]